MLTSVSLGGALQRREKKQEKNTLSTLAHGGDHSQQTSRSVLGALQW